MAITFPYGFTVTSTEPVDSRLVMTPAQMKSAGVRMPDYYLTVCSSGDDAGKLFIFDKSMEPDDTYGRFRLIRYSDLEGMPDIPTQLSQLSDDSDHRLVTDEWIAAWNAKLTEADVAQVALTGSYNDLSDTPGIPTKLSELADDATHRLVTDAEKEIWNTGTPNKIETVKVDGVPLIPDDQKAVNVDLSKKVDKVEGKQLSTEDYTSAEKAKLAHVADNAQVNVIERVKVNGLQLTPDAQKAVDVTVPTKESDLVADRGYITADVDNLTNYYTKAVIDEKLSGSMQYKTASAKADGTPNVANPEERTIYLVPSKSSKTR
ncbi:MAG: hypothetical protein IJV02_05640, partial [Candidatus Methanomethylophilaceae archaeon]|nr:hypothetical protein [Candidatus Methanomethylophilaceae archaeon]